MARSKKADARARVYKYVAQDGTVYYSFTRQKKMINPSQILTLESRVGTHLENFIPRFRAESSKFVRRRPPKGEEEEE